MSHRSAFLLVSGLALGLVLVVLGSLILTQAQASVSQGDLYVPIGTPMSRVEGQGSIRPTVRQPVNRAVDIEPIQVQIDEEKITVEALPYLIETMPPEARLAERYTATQALRPEFANLIGRIVDEAPRLPPSVLIYHSAKGAARAAAECVVTSTADGGPGTLRRCLQDSVAGDTITFDTGVFPPTSPATIALSSALPWIITDSLTVDASDAGVILDGSGLSSGSGFVIVGVGGVKIRGFQIIRFPLDGVAIAGGATNTIIGGDRFTGSGSLGQGNLISGNGRMGIWFQDTRTMSNTVAGNYVGTNISGTASFANAQFGVFIGFGARNNTIGGVTHALRNLISGNANTGIWIQDPGTSGNCVCGNYIGTNILGTAAIPNYDGVFVGWESTENAIGGDAVGSGNLISGNDHIGVKIHGERTANNRVVGNYIGTDVYGTDSLPNYMGVVVLSQASDTTIGGETPGSRNLISGNTLAGVWIQGRETSTNTVLGNYIGTNVFGTESLGNKKMGVFLGGAMTNTVGGTTPGARNLISGNGLAGVWIQDSGTSGNQVLGNYIGTDISGVHPISNVEMGVFIQAGAVDNIVGGEASGARNLISGNGRVGVSIEDEGTSGNRVLGNYIGTDISGIAPLGNAENGIVVHNGATSNTIGGNTSEERNLISGNGKAGVWIEGVGTSGNQVLGNYIGSDVSGTAVLSNAKYGVFIQSGATDNIVGGEISGARNLISGNGRAGVWVEDSGTSRNQVLGNYIGTDISGVDPLGNVEMGVLIQGGAVDNIIGGEASGARNLISGNGWVGVWIWGEGTSGNRVLGNYIGTDILGMASLGNEEVGVLIGFGAVDNIIGGDATGARNVISGNGWDGVWIQNGGTSGNQILGNYIGLQVSGPSPLGNGLAGVFIGFGATNNVIGISNTIAHNMSGGVVVSGTTSLYNTVTRNVIRNNGGPPIDLVDLPIPLSPSPPMFICFSVPDNAVLGTACPGCRVEIFANPTSAPAGTIFLDTVWADASGGFSLTPIHFPANQYLAATATDLNGTTSEFSGGFSWLDNPCHRIYLPLVTRSSGRAEQMAGL